MMAAATNSVIVTLPSFSAFASHLGSAQFDWWMLALTSITAVIGAWLGARSRGAHPLQAQFHHVIIDSAGPREPHCKAIGDIDGDGFVDVMAALPIDLDELYRIYIGKNVLNNFRQANGYKSGSYIKVWMGREDNEHLFELVGTLDDASSSFASDLYLALESRYAANKRS